MKNISFIIPLYNEEKRIDKTFEALEGVRIPRGLKLSEVIFVDDGSSDKTFETIQKWISKKGRKSVNYSTISYKPNKGKGNAIREGMLASKSDYSLFFDADISTPLEELNKFMPLINKNVDVIIGTRKNGHSTVIRHQPLYRELMGKVFTKITQTVLQVHVTDFTCGFKAFSRKATETVFNKAIISGWGYDAEIIYLAQSNGFSLQEVAVTWSNDDRTKVDLKSAILNTLFELVEVRWYHSFKPTLQSVFGQRIQLLPARVKKLSLALTSLFA